MEKIAQQALSHHVEDHHLATAVVAVLHHHAVPRGAFGGLHQSPAAVERDRGRHLDRRVLPRLHRFDADRNVPPPGSRVEDEVDVVALAQALEVGIASCVELRRLVVRVDDPRRHLLGAGLVDVADRDDVDAVDAQEVAHMAAALETDADETDPHPLERRRGETGAVRLERRFVRLASSLGVVGLLPGSRPGANRGSRGGRPNPGRLQQLAASPEGCRRGHASERTPGADKAEPALRPARVQSRLRRQRVRRPAHPAEKRALRPVPSAAKPVADSVFGPSPHRPSTLHRGNSLRCVPSVQVPRSRRSRRRCQ